MPWPHPRLIAHRGGALLAPENTLPAFVEAARRGYRAIECDVRLTADGVPVLLHDRSLLRTTGCDRRVDETGLATVQGLDAGSWFHPRFAGTRIPTLEAAVACWLELGQQALIELKTDADGDAVGLARASAAIVARCWSGPPPVFISFNATALAATSEPAPRAGRALLLGTWHDDWRQRMAGACADALDIEHGLATRERIAAIHAAGAAVVAWTVNDPGRCAELLAMGIDAVTTDAIGTIDPRGSGA